MNISSSELALLVIVGIDVVIVGALIIVRVAGLRGSRPTASPTFIAPDDQAAQGRNEEPGRRVGMPGGPATAAVAATTDAEAVDDRRSSHGGGESERLPAATNPDIDWQMALRRESARAARYGRSMTLMQFEIDQPVRDEPAAPGQLAEADALLAGLIAAQVRVSDYVAHPSAGRYWLLLTETEERAALWVADRIRSQFVRRRPTPPGLLVGWAGTEAGGGVESSLRRAAERVHEDRRRVRAGFAQAGPSEAPVEAALPASVDDALATLERLWKSGFVTDEEYRAKRSDILGRF